MTEDVKPTRKNLMEIEERIELSEQGHETLEKKRDGLIMEFMDILDEAKDIRGETETKYEKAQRKLDFARSTEGQVAVRGAAQAREQTPTVTVTSKNIMGVTVPQIDAATFTTQPDERGYGFIGTSPAIDETAQAYEELLEQIVLVAELEQTMHLLLEEIEQTKRRVNALEHKLLPELRGKQEYIEQKLEEQEREEIFRMKKIKEKRQED